MCQCIVFTKLSGSGNDFVCIDNRGGEYDRLLDAPEQISRFAKVICRRGLGVGADGVIFAGRPEVEGFADIAARFFEADGSEVELCGNGTACFTRWTLDNDGCPDDELKILTPAGVVRAAASDGQYMRVCIPSPEEITKNLNLQIDGDLLTCDFAITGVPHAITYVDDVKNIDIHQLGPAIRYHKCFQPRGANANFVQVIDEGEIALRTWEFGVEGETFACGTGASAAAILTALRQNWPDKYFTGQTPVRVHAHSGEILRVYFVRTTPEKGFITDVCLETIVRAVYSATLAPDLTKMALTATEPAV